MLSLNHHDRFISIIIRRRSFEHLIFVVHSAQLTSSPHTMGACTCPSFSQKRTTPEKTATSTPTVVFDTDSVMQTSTTWPTATPAPPRSRSSCRRHRHRHTSSGSLKVEKRVEEAARGTKHFSTKSTCTTTPMHQIPHEENSKPSSMVRNGTVASAASSMARSGSLLVQCANAPSGRETSTNQTRQGTSVGAHLFSFQEHIP